MAFVLQRILISDSVSPKCAEYLQSHGISVETKTKLSKAELIAEIPVSGNLVQQSKVLLTEA